MKTQKEFLEALRKERNGWRVTRLGIRRGPEMKLACPITAVAMTLTRQSYDVSRFSLAADALNMPPRLADKIVLAADIRGRYPRLRKLMLQALGLKEG